MRIFELLHRGENDAVRFPAIKKFFQVLTTLRMNWVLSQEVLAPGKLAL